MPKVYFTREPSCKNLLPCLPVSSTVNGFFNSSDVDSIVTVTSNHYGLAIGTTADVSVFGGIVAAVPTATTPGSSVAFYIRPIDANDELAFTFSTSYSTALPASTDVGKFIGFGNTTTVAGATLNMGTIGNAAGTTSGCFLRITGYDIARRQIKGVLNSTHIARMK